MSDSKIDVPEETHGELPSIVKRFNSMMQKTRDLPDNIRLAALSAWRGKERGMAVFAGVFLASLVITTVLSYGCLLYTSPSPRDGLLSRMPSSA